LYRIIWSPWRYEYIKTFTSSKEYRECILCVLPRKDDEESLIIYRGKYTYVVLNAYPYNSGHLMIVPYRHVKDLNSLSNEELMELMNNLKYSINVLRRALKPDGFNIGINLGRVAGAGIEDHIHIHVVPRWCGDSNFMPVIAGIKSLPIALRETYNLLKKHWVIDEKNSGEEALDH